jgi:GxxExxY protein
MLGYGFLEKVYENALQVELRNHGFRCTTQFPIEVSSKRTVGKKVILELKASEALNKTHELQLINYLKATSIEVGLLLNFGATPRFKRKIYTNK